jgi:serine/threonine-protein kinase
MLFVHICNEPPPKLRTWLNDVPSELDQIVQRALSKRPADRFGSCEEMKAALAPFVHLEAMHDTLPSLAPHALSAGEAASTEALVSAHVPRRASAKRALLAAGLVVGAGSALLPLTRPAESPRPRPGSSAAP